MTDGGKSVREWNTRRGREPIAKVAGLPRRCAPRNDGRGGADAPRNDGREGLTLLAMTDGGKSVREWNTRRGREPIAKVAGLPRRSAPRNDGREGLTLLAMTDGGGGLTLLAIARN